MKIWIVTFVGIALLATIVGFSDNRDAMDVARTLFGIVLLSFALSLIIRLFVQRRSVTQKHTVKQQASFSDDQDGKSST